MVGVIVGQHESVDSPDAFPGERGAECVRIATGVHENRGSALKDEGRIALAYIEHSQTRTGGNRRAHREHGQE